MFGIGGFEFFLILIFGFLIVGPDRLPAMAKTVGQAINKFRGAQEEMNKVIKTEVYDPDSKDPFKDPLEVLEKMGSSKGSDAKVDAKASSPSSANAASGERRESFSERKARYEKERAAKKAADAEKEAEAKRAANAAKDTPKSDSKPQVKQAEPEKAQPAAAEERGE